MTAPVDTLNDLTDDGQTFKLDDGRMLRLKFEPDSDASINDYDSDGKVEWTRNDRDYGRSVRPRNFTGRARIIEREHDSALWWEPYEELTEQQIREEMPRIRDLVRFGFKGIIVEVLDGTDAYNRPIVTNVASLWAVEWDADDDYIRSIVSDLVSELGLT